MTRLRKYVRMARQRRLNFWQARWFADTIDEDTGLVPGSRSFESARPRNLSDPDETMPDTDEDERAD